MPDPNRPDRRDWYRWIALGQIGMEMVSPIVVGLLVDYWLGWAPWVTVIGAVVGFAGGMAHLLTILKNDGPGEDSTRTK